MTNREFFTAVFNNEITDEVIVFAKDALVKLDARNDKRRNTLTKEQIANEGIKADIVAALCAAGKALTASELSTSLGYSTQKITALCKQLTDCGKVTADDVKVKGKGTVKAYKLAE